MNSTKRNENDGEAGGGTMQPLKYLAFLKTVEYGSFTRAAERLNYSQSGVSRMISDLEREWNLTLLERNRSGVKLTSDGSQLLPFVKNLCQSYEELQTQVDSLHGVQSGIIRIEMCIRDRPCTLPRRCRAGAAAVDRVQPSLWQNLSAVSRLGRDDPLSWYIAAHGGVVRRDLVPAR